MGFGGDVTERLAPHSEDAGAGGATGDSSAEGTPAQRRAHTRVGVASAGEPLEAGQEALGGRRRGHLREHVLQSALGGRLGLALRTGGEVGQDALARLMTELSVHQGGQSVSQMLIGNAPLGRVRP